MNSIESYPTPKREMTLELIEMYPSFVRLLLLFIGFLDIVFGGIFLLTALQKNFFDMQLFFVVLFSWIGGISCVVVAKLKELDAKKLIGLVLGITLGIFYIYIIILTFMR